MPLPFNSNIATATGATPSPAEVGTLTIRRQLSQGNFAPLAAGRNVEMTRAPLSPSSTSLSPGVTPSSFTPAAAAPVVVQRALAMATEDGPPPMPRADVSAPPLVAAPVPMPGPAQQGSGIPEYNVSTPYSSGPGVSDADVAAARPGPDGKRVISVGAKSTPKSSPWLWYALAVAAVVAFAD